MCSDMKSLIRTKKSEGWIVTRMGSNHYRWEHEKAKAFVTSSSTPSCPYAIKKIKNDLKKVMKQ